MLKRGMFVLLVAVMLVLPIVSAAGLQDEIKKITHYAEEYETGNINYVKLMVHTAASRENINKLMGAKELEDHGGQVATAAEIKNILGEPNPKHNTRYIWLQSEERDFKLDKEVSVWKKIVFDGRKIQIRLNAFPVAFKKDGEIKVLYHIDVSAEFKTEEEDRDFKKDIKEVGELAQAYSDGPTNDNGEKLARKSTEVERAFNFYAREGAGADKECKDLMNSILGSESRQETQSLAVMEGVFYSGDRVDAVLRLEMCEDCEWRSVNLNLWFEGRYDFDEGGARRYDHRDFINLDNEGFKREIKGALEVMKKSLEQEDMGTAFNMQMKLWAVNDAWNQKSNNVWEQVEQEFEKERSLRSDEEMGNYDWDGENQKREERVRELTEKNFEARKGFYENLFNGIDDVREINSQEVRYNKRLVEEFKLVGSEICDNGVDDNGDEEVDCGDGSCAGDPCGMSDALVGEGNDSALIAVIMYCIEGSCQVREEDLVVPEAVCGDNECEEGEEVTCFEDCQVCPEYEAIKCEGIVLFSGKNENGCDLEPVCIEQNNSCSEDFDCAQPLCGSASCIDGECKIEELALCAEPDCVEGEQNLMSCENGDKIVSDICVEGMWEDTGIECEGEEEEEYSCEENKLYLGDELVKECGEDESCDALRGICLSDKCSYTDCNYESQCGDNEVFRFECEPESGECVKLVIETCGVEEKCDSRSKECVSVYEEEPEEPEGAGEECVVKADCGGVHDVCSNGWCVSLPEVEEPEEPEEEVEDVEEETVICHKPGTPAQKTMELPESAVEGHLGHGDYLGECSENEEIDEEEEESQEQEVEESQEQEVDNEDNNVVEETVDSSNSVDNNVVEETVDSSNSVDNNVVEEVVESSDDEDSGSDDTTEDVVVTGNVISRITGLVTGFRIQEDGDEGDNAGDSDSSDDGGDSGDDSSSDDEGSDDGGDSGSDDSGDDWIDMSPSDDGQDHDWQDSDDNNNNEDSGQNNDHGPVCGDGRCESGEEDCHDDCDKGRENEREREQNKEGEFENKDDMKNDDKKEEEEHWEEKAIFNAEGSCRSSSEGTEANIWFGGWGETFNDFQEVKKQYEEHGRSDWCKVEFENVKKQRKEIEKGISDEFAVWFFEKYMANNADDWQTQMSGIYELYWRNVEISRRLAELSDCVGKKSLPEHKLLSMSYDTEFGSLEYWEEEGNMNLEGIGNVEVISPYMKIWVFPPEDFIKYEMNKAMEEGRFPGPSGEEEEFGPNDEDRKMIKENKPEVIKDIKKMSEDYGGEINAVIQIMDGEELVFNMYAVINENVIMDVEPMPYENVPEEDVRVVLEFDKIYDIIHTSEKEMKGAELESPPWDRKPRMVGGVKKVVNGIKMWMKMNSLISSAEIYPASAKGDVKDMFKMFFDLSEGEGDGKDMEDMEKRLKELEKVGFSKEEIKELKQGVESGKLERGDIEKMVQDRVMKNVASGEMSEKDLEDFKKSTESDMGGMGMGEGDMKSKNKGFAGNVVLDMDDLKTYVMG